MLVRSVTEVRRCGAPRVLGSDDGDREMRCDRCGTRVFTSLAPELVRADAQCGRCGARMSLMPTDAIEVRHH